MVVLFIILTKGLKVFKIKEIPFIKKHSINAAYIDALERRFVRYIKYFFAMTMCLYFVLIFHSLITSDIKYTPEARSKCITEIRQGKDDIIIGKRLLEAYSVLPYSGLPGDFRSKDSIINRISTAMTDSCFKKDAICSILSKALSFDRQIILQNKYFPTLTGKFDTINEALRQIAYNDKTIIPGKSFASLNMNYLKNIKTIRDVTQRLGNDVLGLHNSLLIDTTISPALRDTAINLMYHGVHKIEFATEIVDHENIGIVLTHILGLIFSNLGALVLVYCFLVLYAETIDRRYRRYDKSVLEIKHLFEYHPKEDDKKVISILHVLYGIFIVLTLSQIILELCFIEKAEDINTLFSMISGLSNALALSLLVARFESKSFNSTFSVLVILYLYANIQMLFGVFTIPLLKNPHLIEDFTILIAFVGKCFLYLYVLWTLRTNRLKYYFYNRFDNSPAKKEKVDWIEFVKNIN